MAAVIKTKTQNYGSSNQDDELIPDSNVPSFEILRLRKVREWENFGPSFCSVSTQTVLFQTPMFPPLKSQGLETPDNSLGVGTTDLGRGTTHYEFPLLQLLLTH